MDPFWGEATREEAIQWEIGGEGGELEGELEAEQYDGAGDGGAMIAISRDSVRQERRLCEFKGDARVHPDTREMLFFIPNDFAAILAIKKRDISQKSSDFPW